MPTLRYPYSVLLAVLVASSGLAGTARGQSTLGPPAKDNLDLPFNALPPAGAREEEAPEVVVFNGQVFEANAVVFCIDRSMSLAGGEWETLQKELLRAIGDFSATVEFGFVFFHSETTVYPESKVPYRASAEGKQSAIQQVLATAPSTGSTCIRPALRAAVDMTQRSRTRHKRILLLSDGKPTCTGADTVTYVQETLKELRTINTEKTPIDTVAVGFEVVESFLKSLASESGGEYRRARG